ncbi:uncharacterized protein CTHT_0053850 [Thermochaetoides thermophila DSM 1495]|uniref:Uncharacterized protein n=1 Tax=Chaetomium thermophilum (strain DSM 1495 / CBS 144.50 / IMI 039719) TaxID=759272 RepID=G0SBK0_CHATD|nr:hypothetical protein CTHT_0053850 [Thermochaetoides thermophila DSM 1495]EGS18776.1 hypothetical protein CTHT_0053850 [Thermochaetoides thermophila DSM 1495]
MTVVAVIVTPPPPKYSASWQSWQQAPSMEMDEEEQSKSSVDVDADDDSLDQDHSFTLHMAGDRRRWRRQRISCSVQCAKVHKEEHKNEPEPSPPTPAPKSNKCLKMSDDDCGTASVKTAEHTSPLEVIAQKHGDEISNFVAKHPGLEEVLQDILMATMPPGERGLQSLQSRLSSVGTWGYKNRNTAHTAAQWKGVRAFGRGTRGGWTASSPQRAAIRHAQRRCYCCNGPMTATPGQPVAGTILIGWIADDYHLAALGLLAGRAAAGA